MAKAPIPVRCKGCLLLHTGGQKNGVYDRWCCRFGNAAAKVQAQCIQSGAKRLPTPSPVPEN